MNRIIELNKNEIVDITIEDNIFKNCRIESFGIEDKHIDITPDRYSNTNAATAIIKRNIKLVLNIDEVVMQKYIGKDI